MTNCDKYFLDGFHSSASDPVLQQKYGHVIEKPMIAPPPTAQSFPTHTQPATVSAPTVFNRYVPYDLNNSPPPVTFAQYPPPQTVSAPVYHHAPPTPFTIPPPNVVRETKVLQTVSPNPTAGTANANKLLGNKAVTTDAHDDLPSIINPQIRRVDDRKFVPDSPKKHSTNEEVVITANANSSSIL